MPHYINNKQLLDEFKICKKEGKTTRQMDKYIVLMVTNISKGFRYKDTELRNDVQQAAYVQLYTKWQNFDEEKGSNIFAYYTQIIRTAIMKDFNMFYLKHRRSSENVSFISLDSFLDNDKDTDY